jgi:nucleotide-binding universal stress UspA family protein
VKKCIVPTDFSETSKNAARFAVQLAAEIKDCSLVLYHAFDPVTAGSDGSLLPDNDQDARKQISLSALNNLKNDLARIAPVPIACVAEEGSLINNLEKIFHHQELDLIIMGITGATRLDQILMGSNTLKVVEQKFCPVMIIPPDAVYRSIKTVIFCSDFKDVEATTPIKALRSILDIFKPAFHVVNVDTEHYVELSDAFKAEKARLEDMLSGYNPEFSFIRMYGFVESINLFAQDRQADLIITVPRRHSFLGGLFKTSHTQKLAYHSHIPILAVHE